VLQAETKSSLQDVPTRHKRV